jgi:hypothetical protein
MSHGTRGAIRKTREQIVNDLFSDSLGSPTAAQWALFAAFRQRTSVRNYASAHSFMGDFVATGVIAGMTVTDEGSFNTDGWD